MFREDAVNIVYALLRSALSSAPLCFSLALLVSFKDHLYLHPLLPCFVHVFVSVYAHIVGL